MYVVECNHSVQESLAALDPPPELLDTLESLRVEPRPEPCREVPGAESKYFVRFGRHRLDWRVDEAGKRVLVEELRQMPYELLVATKVIRRAQIVAARRWRDIAHAVEDLQDVPRPNGCRKLKGREGYRIRVGDFRVIYSVEDRAQTVTVLAISPRGQRTYG